MKKLFLLTLVLIALFYCGYVLRNPPQPPTDSPKPSSYAPIPLNTTSPLKVDPAAVLAFAIESQAKLITGELALEQEIAVKDIWLGLSLFSKEQSIIFPATAIYTVDLSSFSPEDIIHSQGYRLDIYVNEPYVYSVSIDNANIRITDPKKGLLRFGDISLTPDEMKSLLNIAEQSMKEKATAPQHIAKVKENTAATLKEIFKTILDHAGFLGYDIVVEFKDAP